MDTNVKAVFTELCKVQNYDILKAVMELGDDSPEQSFMFGFTQLQPLSFDDYVHIENLINFELKPQMGIETELYVDMSKAYDDYLKRTDEHNDAVSLGKDATARLEAIVSRVEDADPRGGWSGSYYGWLMRQVQNEALKLNTN